MYMYVHIYLDVLMFTYKHTYVCMCLSMCNLLPPPSALNFDIQCGV